MQISTVGEFAGTSRFELRSRLGHGAVGVVYEALDRERNASVALKTLRRPTAESLLLLKNEFRTVQDLRHPNLVHLGELFEENGQWFFTMEFVNGVSFIRHVRPDGERAVAWDEARLRGALEQLARGLHALHRAEKVHRDVKPSNILVTREGRVVVLDFGVVSDVRGKQSDDGLIGTAAYMAPEQVVGDEVGPAADWYAVGTMIYEALTGALPFEGSSHEILERKLVAEAPLPSARVPGVPRDLDELCGALLRMDPATRPAGAEVVRRLGVVPTAEEDRASYGQIFVGRTRELDALRQAFADAHEHSVSVVVDGESGVGKSCLVKTFSEWMQREDPGAVVFTGRCYERESVPYKAVDHVVDDLTRYLGELAPADLSDVLPPYRALLPRVFPVLRGVPGIAGSQAPELDTMVPKELRARVFDALRVLFARVARRQRVVIAIDDLQWADADSLALLTELLRAPESPPVLLVVTRRTGDNARPLTRDLTLPGDVRSLVLGKLAPAEARELVMRMVPTESESDVAAIAAEAMGHPLFIDELVRQRSIGGHVHEVGRLDDALWARVERLAPGARSLVEGLAVAGLPVTQEVAAEVAGLSLGELFDAVSELRAAHLVRTDGAGRSDAIDTYHDRIRESVLAHLTAEVRKAWHVRLAQALEPRQGVDPERLAVHWQSAGRLDRAAEYAAAAADAAGRALAFDRAVRLYRLALSLDDASPSRGERMRLLAEALTNAGRLAEAAETRLALAATCDAREALVQRRIAAEQLLCSGHFDEGVSTIRVALAQAGLRFPETPLAALLRIIACRIAIAVRGTKLRERDVEQLSAAEALRVDCSWSAGRGLLMTDTIRGVYFQTLNFLAALKLGDPMRLVRALVMNGLAGGSPSRARTRALNAQAGTLAARLGTPEAEALVAAGDGGSAYFWGEWQRAVAPLARAEELFRDRCPGSAFELNSVRLMLYRVLSYRGAGRELAARVPPVLREAEQHNDLYAQINVRSVALLFLGLAADDPARVRADIERATDELSGRGYHVQHYLCLFALGQVDLYDGRAREADARYRAQAAALKKSMLMRVQIVRIQTLDLRARTAIEIARERKDGAEVTARLAEAEKLVRAVSKEEAPWAAALAAAGTAGIAAARSDGVAATEALRQAIRLFDDADMALHAAAARRALGEWVGGDDGARLVTEADAAMRAETVKDPRKLARLLVPAAPVGSSPT
jgi:hypothetical protein